MDTISNNSSDDMICGHCNLTFDENEHLPRLFSKCGHTYCTSCIYEFIQKSIDGIIICPEDNQETQIGDQGINNFPKNMTLIKMIKKKQQNLERKSLIFNNSEELSTIDQDQNNLTQFSNMIQINEHEQLINKFCSPALHKNYQNYIEQDNSNNQSSEIKLNNGNIILYNTLHQEQHIKLCPEHNKPLDLICLDHRQKICQKCALSQQGKHRNHQISQEEEVHQEISQRAENLEQTFKQVNQFFNYLDKEQYMQSISNLINEDKEKQINYVERQFQGLISALEKVKREKIQEISQQYIKIINETKRQSKPHDKVMTETQVWKKKAQDLLSQYNENKDKQDITYDLLPQMNSSQNSKDIIYLGEELYKDLQTCKQKPLEKFKKKLQEGLLFIEFDESSLNSEILTKMFCKIQSSSGKPKNAEEKIPQNQIQKTQLEVKQDTNQFYKNQNFQQQNIFHPQFSQDISSIGDIGYIQESQQRIPTSNVDENDLLDFNNIGFTEFGDNPVMESNYNLSNSIKQGQMNAYMNSQFALNKQNSFGANNNNNNSANPIIGKQAFHQPWMSYSMGNINPEFFQQYVAQPQQNGQMIFISPAQVLAGGDGISSFGQHQYQQQIQQTQANDSATQQVSKGQQPQQQSLNPNLQSPNSNPQKTSRQNSASKNKDNQQINKQLNYQDNLDNSTIKDNSLNNSVLSNPVSKKSDLPPKVAQGKKKSIPIPKLNDKYMGILNTLQRDQLEILDLTGAELGDSGIQYVCEILKNCSNVKSLKLLKNKLSDEGAQYVMNTIAQNNKIISVNFAQNNLSELSLDFFIQYFQNQQSSIKQLCLNQNNIPLQKNKAKINELKKIGINATV